MRRHVSYDRDKSTIKLVNTTTLCGFRSTLFYTCGYIFSSSFTLRCPTGFVLRKCVGDPLLFRKLAAVAWHSLAEAVSSSCCQKLL